MHITPFKACLPILEKIPAAAAFFDEAKFSFSDFFTQGLLRTTPTENFYVYRITTVKKTATGLIACADVQDYLKGHIKKHEQTIISNEEKQTALMLQNHAVIKPVLLMHDPLVEIVSLYDKIIKTKTPDLDVRIKKTQHQLWAVETGPDERALTSLFAEKINTAYIADGHHRAASTATLYRQNKNLKLFCAFFSSDDLIIRPFHRIITDMNGLSSEKFLKKIFGNFEKKFLTEKKSPRRKNELILFFVKKIFQINFPKKNLKKKFEKIFQEKFSKKFARKDLSKKNFKSLLEFGTFALHTTEKKL